MKTFNPAFDFYNSDKPSLFSMQEDTRQIDVCFVMQEYILVF